MKSFFLVGFLLLLSIVAQGNKLEPLIGSAWGIKNPQKLPFSVCHIQANKFTAGIIKNYTVWHQPLTLHCETRPLDDAPQGLEFRIPFKARIKSVGFTGIIGITPFLFEVSGLHNKSASALYDHYKGFCFSVGIPAFGINIKSYRTTSNIQLSTVARTLYAGLEIDKSELTFKPVSAIKKKWCLDNKYIINGETTQARDQIHCDQLETATEEGQRPPFDASELNKLEFVYQG